MLLHGGTERRNIRRVVYHLGHTPKAFGLTRQNFAESSVLIRKVLCGSGLLRSCKSITLELLSAASPHLTRYPLLQRLLEFSYWKDGA
jgi:hypothetical protein